MKKIGWPSFQAGERPASEKIEKKKASFAEVDAILHREGAEIELIPHEDTLFIVATYVSEEEAKDVMSQLRLCGYHPHRSEQVVNMTMRIKEKELQAAALENPFALQILRRCAEQKMLNTLDRVYAPLLKEYADFYEHSDAIVFNPFPFFPRDSFLERPMDLNEEDRFFMRSVEKSAEILTTWPELADVFALRCHAISKLARDLSRNSLATFIEMKARAVLSMRQVESKNKPSAN